MKRKLLSAIDRLYFYNVIKFRLEAIYYFRIFIMGLTGIDRKVDSLVSMQGDDCLLLNHYNHNIIGDRNFALAA